MVLLFCKEKNFNKEKTKFLLRHQGHESLVELIEKIREDWQNDFADLRNRHEHDGSTGSELNSSSRCETRWRIVWDRPRRSRCVAAISS